MPFYVAVKTHQIVAQQACTFMLKACVLVKNLWNEHESTK